MFSTSRYFLCLRGGFSKKELFTLTVRPPSKVFQLGPRWKSFVPFQVKAHRRTCPRKMYVTQVALKDFPDVSQKHTTESNEQISEMADGQTQTVTIELPDFGIEGGEQNQKFRAYLDDHKTYIDIALEQSTDGLAISLTSTKEIIDVEFQADDLTENKSEMDRNTYRAERIGIVPQSVFDNAAVVESGTVSVLQQGDHIIKWREQLLDLRKLPQYYMKLSKIRLTGLIVITSIAGYGMAPDPFTLQTFMLGTVGTGLTSCSANAINQYFEVPFDSQMKRTKNRVLVKGLVTPLHALTFAGVSGSLGLAILTAGVNPFTASLGAFNLVLYTLIYTPMKRVSIVNTWVGSIVGAVPPMMGWTACTGTLDAGAVLLGAILYAWQFPHFNSLSWSLRGDYSRAGYCMTSLVNPDLCKRVALRYSIGLIGLSTLAPVIGMTEWSFAVTSLVPNLWLSYLAWNFYKEGNSKSSKKLFRFSLIHIPLLMVLMFAGKKRSKENGQQKSIVEKNCVPV